MPRPPMRLGAAVDPFNFIMPAVPLKNLARIVDGIDFAPVVAGATVAGPYTPGGDPIRFSATTANPFLGLTSQPVPTNQFLANEPRPQPGPVITPTCNMFSTFGQWWTNSAAGTSPTVRVSSGPDKWVVYQLPPATTPVTTNFDGTVSRAFVKNEDGTWSPKSLTVKYSSLLDASGKPQDQPWSGGERVDTCGWGSSNTAFHAAFGTHYVPTPSGLSPDGLLAGLGGGQALTLAIASGADLPLGPGAVYRLLCDGVGATQLSFTGFKLPPAAANHAWDHATDWVPIDLSGVASPYLAGTPTTPHFTLTITYSDAADPLTNIRLLMPDVAGEPDFATDYEEEPFYPPYLDRLAWMESMRTYAFLKMWYNAEQHWADRVLPSFYAEVDPYKNRQPIERVIGLANALLRRGGNLKEVWWNIPTLVDDDYIDRLTQLLIARLDPRIAVRIELGGEPWNAQADNWQWEWNGGGPWVSWVPADPPGTPIKAGQPSLEGLFVYPGRNLALCKAIVADGTAPFAPEATGTIPVAALNPTPNVDGTWFPTAGTLFLHPAGSNTVQEYSYTGIARPDGGPPQFTGVKLVNGTPGLTFQGGDEVIDDSQGGWIRGQYRTVAPYANMYWQTQRLIEINDRMRPAMEAAGFEFKVVAGSHCINNSYGLATTRASWRYAQSRDRLDVLDDFCVAYYLQYDNRNGDFPGEFPVSAQLPGMVQIDAITAAYDAASDTATVDVTTKAPHGLNVGDTAWVQYVGSSAADGCPPGNQLLFNGGQAVAAVPSPTEFRYQIKGNPGSAGRSIGGATRPGSISGDAFPASIQAGRAIYHHPVARITFDRPTGLVTAVLGRHDLRPGAQVRVVGNAPAQGAAYGGANFFDTLGQRIPSPAPEGFAATPGAGGTIPAGTYTVSYSVVYPGVSADQSGPGSNGGGETNTSVHLTVTLDQPGSLSLSFPPLPGSAAGYHVYAGPDPAHETRQTQAPVAGPITLDALAAGTPPPQTIAPQTFTIDRVDSESVTWYVTNPALPCYAWGPGPDPAGTGALPKDAITIYEQSAVVDALNAAMHSMCSTVVGASAHAHMDVVDQLGIPIIPSRDAGFSATAAAAPEGQGLPAGTYPVAYAWVYPIGEVPCSNPIEVEVAAGQGIAVTLPPTPKAATGANVYAADNPDGMLQLQTAVPMTSGSGLLVAIGPGRPPADADPPGFKGMTVYESGNNFTTPPLPSPSGNYTPALDYTTHSGMADSWRQAANSLGQYDGYKAAFDAMEAAGLTLAIHTGVLGMNGIGGNYLLWIGPHDTSANNGRWRALRDRQAARGVAMPTLLPP